MFISPRPCNFLFITILTKSSQYSNYSISFAWPKCNGRIWPKSVYNDFDGIDSILLPVEAYSFSTSSSFRLSDVLGLFPSPLTFSFFCFAWRVTIVSSFKHTTSVNVKLKFSVFRYLWMLDSNPLKLGSS